jgi:hypothetical protein
VVSKGEDDQDGDSHGDDQMLGFGKKQKQKAQGKGISGYELFVLVIKTLSECDHI